MGSRFALNTASLYVFCALLAGCGSSAPLAPAVSDALQSKPAIAPVPVRFEAKAKVGLWADTGNVIFGQNARGDQTVTAINVAKNGCDSASGIKVDHAENLWVACVQYEYENGALQEYPPGSSKPAATFYESIACGSGCTFEANAFDVAFDAKGHVFAGTYSEECKPSCQDAYAVLWWNQRSSGSAAMGISDPNLDAGAYVDVDNDGNLYLSGQGCIEKQCGVVVDEVTNPTTSSPTVTNLIFLSLPTSEDASFALYISNQGKVMNLLDPNSRTIAQYALPWITGEQPFNTLGPTRRDYYGLGLPENGGFDRGDKRFAIGDYYGWINVGKVKKNRWSPEGDINLNRGVFDAAYVPSDK